MSREIELKLALPESAQRALLRHPLLKRTPNKQTYHLVNLYYDTPRLELRRHGVALRLRAQGKVWLQTVKCAGEAAGGLSSRPEWETPYVGHFDFSAIDHPAVRDWLNRPKLRTRIAPLFETNFTRTAWILEPAPGTQAMLVIDRGWIAAGGRREAISEIEIELMHGDPAQLFALARSLAEHVALAPAPLSKADRGYRLFQQIAPAPVKAAPLKLAADAHPAAAFSRIALSCLDHLQHNHAGAVGSEDPEYIHQMRVATRRLRAALRLFGPLLPDDFATPIIDALRDLMQVLGEARDLDVLLAEIAEPVLQALPDEPRLAALIGLITEQRFDRRRAAVDFLRSPRYGLITLDILAKLHAHAEKVGAGETANVDENGSENAAEQVDAELGQIPVLGQTPAIDNPDAAGDATPSPSRERAGERAKPPPQLIEFAENRLRRLRKKVLGLAARARIDDPPSLHALRIAVKRLRYALEFFAPLAAPAAMRRVLGHLARLQETLGQINDLANAGALLMACADDDAPLREAVTLIGGWHGPRHQKLLAEIAPGLKHLGNLRLPKLRP